MNDHFAVINSYLALSAALEINPAAYATVFHPDIEQIEYPNLLTRTTQHRGFEDILSNIRAGREILHNPQFEQTKMHAGTDDCVVLETRWHATIMNDFGLLVRGGQVSAQFCMIFEFKDGLILRHRTYRCYDPIAE
ncbi:SnoaL-like domain-containing protein [Hymenobacter daecheongensis DSM 21074]|uniref:SnoaL-like domain-containing protein n=1 Tax=Hymenobacter daecheongensis DSM 21074 TaxID=1121955 RepID=A0A1M6AT15_9BACT|nr:nuclear transport factor 2 family protein [Hymenobacter daecheongensis]SHI39616.1 SnoaL-like domain-containing protein [Hymenobacter daecheongensis DSM 21074]